MTTQVQIYVPRRNHLAALVKQETGGEVTIDQGERRTMWISAGNGLIISEVPRPEAVAERTYSHAERMAGVPFNPGNNLDVADSKDRYAACIDELLGLTQQTVSPEQARLANIALQHLQAAQMFATKAITWKD